MSASLRKIVIACVLLAAAAAWFVPASAKADTGPPPRVDTVNVVLQNVSRHAGRINPRCAPGTHVFRIWRMYPGPGGEIVTPGVLKLVLPGAGSFVYSRKVDVAKVTGKRYYEFYDTAHWYKDLQGHKHYYDGRLAPLSQQFRQADVDNATVTDGANPMLKLVKATCMGE